MNPPSAENLLEYRCVERLRDGGTILIRAIRPDDRARLLHHFQSLSPESVYFRFFGLKRGLTEADLDIYTKIDFARHVGLAATIGEGADERFIGVGRYIAEHTGDSSAEVAFAVLDEHQGRGIGTVLLEHLAHVGRAHGVREFRADVLQQNARMLDVFLNSGFRVRENQQQGTIHVAFEIDETPSFAIAHRMREEVANRADKVNKKC